MGTRVATTDVEIIAAAIEAVEEAANDVSTDGYLALNLEEVHHAAHLIVRKLTMPPEKTSDITGFEEDDG
tara:strand:+ start:328 stop:537 length:210 start_codon:yes stop_codon:yes gene_type:complete